jgi:hypothetical protein
VASSMGSKFFGTEPRETNRCVHLCLLLPYDLILEREIGSNLFLNDFGG